MTMIIDESLLLGVAAVLLSLAKLVWAWRRRA
jgi:hypothetical protein